MKRFIISLILFVPLSILAQDAVATLPFDIQGGHIYVKVSVDGSEPLNFAFDTGARANLLHEDVAKKLDFTITGTQQVNGASGTVIIKSSVDHDLEFGDWDFRGETFLLMNLDHLGDEDHPMDGVIGGSILDQFITELNFDNSEIKLYSRDDFQVPDEFKAQRISLMPFRIPVITAKLDFGNGLGLEGPYLIDTGAALALRLNSPLVKKERLTENIKPNYAYKGKALNTESTDYIGRLPGFSLLGHEFQGFPIRMATNTGGVSGRSDIDGIIGLELLKRFNLIFDYRMQKMYFQPSLLYDAFFLENFSGLKVRKENGRLHVEQVTENSPADEAGLTVGDQIISVDGQKNMGRTDFKEYVQPMRKDVKLEVIREDKTILVSLKPRKII